MTPNNSPRASLSRFLAALCVVVLAASCSGNGSNTTPSTTTPATPSVSNSATVEVNLGPLNNYFNGIFTTVQVCEPGSTTNCTSIPDVLVDTGSTGLHVLSSALGSLSLSSIQIGGNPLQECIQYYDLSYDWGPVAEADIHMAGETASSVPIEIMSANPAYAVPNACLPFGSNGAVPNNTLQELGANGILGVGNLAQDCGTLCTSATNNVQMYYTCTGSGCVVPSVPTTQQVTNPVALFSQDNNGVLISLPSIPATGQASASGSLIFGVATQSNNALGSAQIYATDINQYFTTTYKGVQYPESFVDSGSNLLYILDAATLGTVDCADAQGLYCPSSTLSITATNTGMNGVSAPLTFSIANADSLLSNTTFAAFNDLGGDSGTGGSSDYFDYGLPFFYGRNVFVGIAGTTAPNGANAPYGYWAF